MIKIFNGIVSNKLLFIVGHVWIDNHNCFIKEVVAILIYKRIE